MAQKRPREDGHGGLSQPQHSLTCSTSHSESSALNPLTHRPFSKAYYRLLATRQQLPIFASRQVLQNTVRDHQVSLLVGETGSGKTTQVPHFLAEMQETFKGRIACTQPRRIAALSVAARVSEEMDVALGAEVGYHVRFDSRLSAATKVLYMTDGMLLREAFADAELNKYSVIVVDEVHERTLYTDVVLGLLKQLLKKRPTLRLVVMSATLDVAKLQSFFPGAPLVHVSGRLYDVEVFYETKPVEDYVTATVARAVQLHQREPAGDILCFLTGEVDIELAVAALKASLGKPLEGIAGEAEDTKSTEDPAAASATAFTRPPHAVVLPLYGSLSLQEQQKVFDSYPADTRKIVLATNIAETSVTIDGVVHVIDCGYQKQTLYNAEARVDFLLPALISRASAEQRRGRAGRTCPGKCFRLFTEADFASFPVQSPPEVLRANVVNTVLLLLKLGVENPCGFPFIDAPSDTGMSDAFYQLLYFGAVDGELRLTDFGRQMAEIPVDAPLARMLLRAEKHGCAADAIVVAAMLETGNVFLRPALRRKEAREAHAEYADPVSDHITLFKVFHGYYQNQRDGTAYCRAHFLRHQALEQAVKVYHQLRRLLGGMGITVQSTYRPECNYVDTVALRKAVLEGFFTQAAYLIPLTGPNRAAATCDSAKRIYRTVRDALHVCLHRQSVLTSAVRPLPTWIVFHQLEVQGDDGAFVRVASAVEVNWLLEVSSFFTDLEEIPDGEVAQALRRAQEARARDAAK